MRKNSIIYVNFSQYDNTGRILDYLLNNFQIVAQFSYDHLRLKSGRRTNYLRVYKNKKIVEERKFAKLRTPSFLLFPSLPLVAFLMISQTVYHVIRLRLLYGIFDNYLTVNAFSAWIGIFLKILHLTRHTIFWVWDYFPVEYPDWRMKFARWIYWQFDKPCMLWSDKIAFTNSRLLTMRLKSNHLRKDYKKLIVPIGTKISKTTPRKKSKIIIGFLGMLKEHQGLDLWIENMSYLLKQYPKIQFEVIGSGPEEIMYKKKVEKYKNNIRFYGFIEDQNKIQKIIKRWTIGLATYYPVKSNESYWGDPSKIKTYIGAGIPAITTNVSFFSKEIRRYNAGLVIKYTKEDLLLAIKTILRKRITFSKNAFRLAGMYDYNKLYKKFFS